MSTMTKWYAHCKWNETLNSRHSAVARCYDADPAWTARTAAATAFQYASLSVMPRVRTLSAARRHFDGLGLTPVARARACSAIVS